MTADESGPEPAEEGLPASPEAPESPSSLGERDLDLATDGDRGPTTAGDRATVALVYGRTVYGAMALHTDREAGFDERELEVLDELGETIGHALTAIERTHLLLSDSRVEVDLSSADEGALLVALSEATGTEWTLDGLVPATEGELLAYLSTDAEGAGVDAARGHAGVSDVRTVATGGGTTLEVRAGGGMLANPLLECGANVVGATASDGRCELTVELSSDTAVRAVVNRVRGSFPGTDLRAKREVEPTDGEPLLDETDMTDRQREALEAAFRAGYFDWPRDSTAEEVAESLDIASPTLHSHLRKAENRLLSEFFEG